MLTSRDNFALYCPPRGGQHDSPLATIYRIYAAIICREDLAMRTEIEYFHRHHKWPVSRVPNPPDKDVLRYSIVAVITILLSEASNRLIELGLPRDAPTIMTDEQMERQKARPKVLEQPPAWALKCPPLQEPLIIPDARGEVVDETDPKADPFMLKRNILTTALPIFFV